MRTAFIAKKIIATILSIALPMTSTYTLANGADPSVVGRQAQDFGRELLNSWQATTPTLNNGALSMPGGEPLNVKDLFPSSSQQNERPASFYFPDSYSTDSAGYESVHNSESQMTNQGAGAQAHMWDDAQKVNPSIQGAAYKILLDMSNRSRPDFRNDPMMHTTRTTLGNIDALVAEFGDCSEETTLEKKLVPVHLAEYERCERLFKPEGGACTLNHEIKTQRTTYDVFIGSPGRTYLTVRFDLKNGSWTHISPTDGDARTAKIPTLDFNEVCGQSPIAERSVLLHAYDWVGHGYPGKIDTSVLYNVIQHPTCSNNLVGIVQIVDTDVSADTEYLLGGQFSMAIEQLTADEWYPESCAKNAQHIDDGFCDAEVVEVRGPTAQGSECITVGATAICPGDEFYNAMKPPPTKKLSKLTQEATMSTLQCNYNIGQMECWTDINGNTQCPYNNGEFLSSCEELDANPSCGFIGSSCLDGGRGDSGTCYIFEDTYDCGGGVGVPQWESKVTYNCSGPIRCMGDDCIDITKTQNPDFGKAAALLNAAQFMGQDMACSDGAIYNPDDDNPQLGCTVFGGTPGDCKKAVGGVVDCCEKPDNVSMADYISLVMSLPKLDTGLMWMAEQGYSVGSSYAALRTSVVEGFTEISEPFASAFDNISGAVDVVKESIDAVKKVFEDAIQDMLTSVFETVGTSGAAGTGAAGAGTVSAGAETAAQEAAQGFMANAGAVISFIGWVYTIYSVAMMVIKMIYKCTQEEMEMNVKRVLKSCNYVGSYCKTEVLGVCIEKRESYCCFSSPLSRIIQQQARAQLGLNFGTARNPMCEGLSVEQIANLDWDRIDLSEWLGILAANGHFPDASQFNIPYLTGQGTTLDLGSRVDAEERALERLKDNHVDDSRIGVSRNYRPSTGAPAGYP